MAVLRTHYPGEPSIKNLAISLKFQIMAIENPKKVISFFNFSFWQNFATEKKRL
jgi:hypothetical protein